MSKLHLSLSAIAVSAALGAGYQWYNKQDIALTEQPEQYEIVQTVDAQSSVVGLRATIPHKSLQQALTNLSAEPYRDTGADSFKKKLWTKGKLPFGGSYKIEVGTLQGGYRWDVEVRRNGQITVGPNGDKLRISVPIHFKGNAGLRGDGARFLKLHRKNFDGSLTAFFDVAVDLDSDWNPVVSVDVSHHWNSKAKFEIIDGVFVSVSGLADDLIADQVNEVKAIIANEINSDVVRNAVAPYWRSWSVPVGTPADLGFGQDFPTFVNVVPEALAFSGVHVDDSGFGIAVNLTAKAEISSEPIDAVVNELPKLERAAWEPGQVKIDLPVSMPMQDIAQLANSSLVGEVFTSNTPVGDVAVELNEIDIYQSGDKLVAGVDFSADVEKEFFSTTGTVYLSAIPRLDEETEVVYLDDVSFSRALDSELWMAVSAVFEGPISASISEHVRYDLSSDIAKAEDMVHTQLLEPGFLEGISLEVNDIDISIADPMVTDGTVSMTFQAAASVDASVQPEAIAAIQ